MTVTIIQPKNSDGKPTPMCTFDADSLRHGHDFQTLSPAITGHDGPPLSQSFVACRRCGAVLAVDE